MSYEFPKKYYRVECKVCGFQFAETEYEIKECPPSSCDHCADPNCEFKDIGELTESEYRDFTHMSPWLRTTFKIIGWFVLIVFFLFCYLLFN